MNETSMVATPYTVALTRALSAIDALGDAVEGEHTAETLALFFADVSAALIEYSEERRRATRH